VFGAGRVRTNGPASTIPRTSPGSSAAMCTLEADVYELL